MSLSAERLAQIQSDISGLLSAGNNDEALSVCQKTVTQLYADPMTPPELKTTWQEQLNDIKKRQKAGGEYQACPHCAEYIRTTANVCRYCQRQVKSGDGRDQSNAAPSSTVVKTAGMVCTNCGYVGPAAIVKPGYGWLEIVLYLCYLIPGIIYSIWRHSSTKTVCAMCGSSTLVPPLSPVGQKHTAELRLESSIAPSNGQPSNSTTTQEKSTPQIVAGTDADLISCPYCAEPIKRAAIKCKHCQTMLTDQQ